MILNLFGIVKSTRKNNVGGAPFKKGGIVHTDPSVKAELLNNQLQSVFYLYSFIVPMLMYFNVD